jgi:hypothetical protein
MEENKDTNSEENDAYSLQSISDVEDDKAIRSLVRHTIRICPEYLAQMQSDEDYFYDYSPPPVVEPPAIEMEEVVSDEESDEETDTAAPDHPLLTQGNTTLCVPFSVANALGSMPNFCKLFNCEYFEGKTELVERDFSYYWRCLKDDGMKRLDDGVPFNKFINFLKRRKAEMSNDAQPVNFNFRIKRSKIRVQSIIRDIQPYPGKTFLIRGKHSTNPTYVTRFRNMEMAAKVYHNEKMVGKNGYRRMKLLKQQSPQFQLLYKKMVSEIPTKRRYKQKIPSVHYSHHMICVKYNQYGVPVIYDSGKRVAKPMFASWGIFREPTVASDKNAFKVLSECLCSIDSILSFHMTFK